MIQKVSIAIKTCLKRIETSKNLLKLLNLTICIAIKTCLKRIETQLVWFPMIQKVSIAIKTCLKRIESSYLFNFLINLMNVVAWPNPVGILEKILSYREKNGTY